MTDPLCLLVSKAVVIKHYDTLLCHGPVAAAAAAAVVCEFVRTHGKTKGHAAQWMRGCLAIFISERASTSPLGSEYFIGNFFLLAVAGVRRITHMRYHMRCGQFPTVSLAMDQQLVT